MCHFFATRVPPIIPRVLAKLAEQKQISITFLESDSQLEKTDEDFDFGEIDEFVDKEKEVD